MKKGFTLMELVIVIIILGVLATLGITQYGRMVEKSRGAEAKAILGDIRKLVAAFRVGHGTIDGLEAPDVNLGTDADQIPSECAGTHYFSYSVEAGTDPSVTITATRCAENGKTPQGGAAAGRTLTLTSDLSTGVDTWGGDGHYY